MAIGRIPEPGTGIPESIVDAKGDLVTATAADTPARLAVGTNEHRLVAASGETTGLKYVADTTNYAIAAKGDLLVGTAADTLQALSVGTNGHTLVADSSTSTGLKWAAAPTGSMTLLSTTTLSTGTTTVSNISGSYKHLYIEVVQIDTSANTTITYKTNSTDMYLTLAQSAGGAGVDYLSTSGVIGNGQNYAASLGSNTNMMALWIYDYANTANIKVCSLIQRWINEGGATIVVYGAAVANHTAAMTSFSMVTGSGTFDGGTIRIYGVN